MKLFTKAVLDQLIKNGETQAAVKGTSSEQDLWPVCKLFDPVRASTWLLTEIIPGTNSAVAFGLADLGIGFPEIGEIDLAEITAYKGRLGLGIERDIYWRPRGPLSRYHEAAVRAGNIVQLPQPPAPVREREEGVEG
ncbi:DUF2958 domain-containing protein [Hyphomicrobium sp. DY-1]|uniref:DUF2958 domain-containing protein n=1 Tax=Hyphomicrobium sp. DY-1 TaxID=3075650 RepID=UPI0039C13135